MCERALDREGKECNDERTEHRPWKKVRKQLSWRAGQACGSGESFDHKTVKESYTSTEYAVHFHVHVKEWKDRSDIVPIEKDSWQCVQW